jgi:hypothetical protein
MISGHCQLPKKFQKDRGTRLVSCKSYPSTSILKVTPVYLAATKMPERIPFDKWVIYAFLIYAFSY